MKVYTVITVTEGEPDYFNDIVAICKTEKRAKEIIKDVKRIKAKDEFDEEGELSNQYGINPDFDMVMNLEHTLKE